MTTITLTVSDITNEEEHTAALARVDALMNADDDSAEGLELRILSGLIADYEEENFEIDLPSIKDAVEFYMDQHSLGREDLANVLDSNTLANEILRGDYSNLSLADASKLYTEWGIPAEVLLSSVD